jgi:hypothetical protein
MLNNISPNFMRNPLGIIALFIVMIYAMAGLVTASASLSTPERLILVIFLAVFPLIVLLVFYLLVTRHSEKLYAPGDFKDEGNYLRAHGKVISDPGMPVNTESAAETKPVHLAGRRIARWIEQGKENRRHAVRWLSDQGISLSPTTFALIEPDEKLIKMIMDLNIPEDGA